MSIILPKSSNYYFLVFITIGFMSIFGAFFARKILKKTADVYILERMHLVQAEMYFYQKEHSGFKYACVSGKINSLSFEIIDEIGKGLSCTTDNNYQHISFYTDLSSGGKYCVDSSGFKGYISLIQKNPGYCSNA